MTIEKRTEAFHKLGLFLKRLYQEESASVLFENEAGYKQLFLESIETEHIHNPWFTPDFVKKAIEGICLFLESDKLKNWLSSYDIEKIKKSKTVGLVMAGNIPFVGFHDLLCAAISGHKCLGKLSSKDNRLFKELINVLYAIEPAFKEYILIEEAKLTGFDAIIATGNDNSSRYFEYYFGKYPHIIRKNRNSLAILDGNETIEDIKRLADDIFMYFGLGCRNVSKLLVPKGYDFNFFFENIEHYNFLLQHNKYMNNYEYNRSIFLLNNQKHLDNGFAIIKEDTGLSSPLSVIYYEEYDSERFYEKYIFDNYEKIQCIVSGKKYIFKTIPFGTSQTPGLYVYADNVDTMAFLISL